MSLDDLLANLADLPADSIPAVIAQLAAAQGMLAARLLTNGNGDSSHGEPRPDRLLDVDEAAVKTGMSRDYIYHHVKELPFTVRVGKGKARRTLRFSELGIEKWIRARSGK